MKTNRAKYINDFNKENYKTYIFRVKRNDAQIINKLESVHSKNKYIKDLILDDIEPVILNIKQIKERIKPVIEKHHIKDVYLFGSYARGEATRESDIDIYCDTGDVITLLQAVAFDEELEEALEKKVDVVTIGSKMHEYFREQLDKDKIKIF